jgi:hypothetical protein
MTLRITTASIIKNFVEIKPIAAIIHIGNNRKIKKFTSTLKFKKNIKKYNFMVTFKFKTDIFTDSQIPLNTSFLFKTIEYLAYANNIFKIMQKKAKII